MPGHLCGAYRTGVADDGGLSVIVGIIGKNGINALSDPLLNIAKTQESRLTAATWIKLK